MTSGERKHIIASLVSCLLAWAAPVHGQNLEKALREGEVVWYTPTAIEDSQKMVQGFQKKYPAVKVTLFRGRERELVPRIINEKRAGRFIADVTTMRGVGYLQLWKRNMIQPYISPESKVYPKGFMDPKGYWTDLYDTYYVWSHNTRLVKTPPRSYEELIHPRFRGMIGMGSEEIEWYSGLIERWGKDRAARFLKSLAAQQVRFRYGHTLVAQLMAAGEFEISLAFSDRIEKMKAQGVPVDWVTTFDPIIVTIHPTAIVADAPHPEAARLFVDFAISKEGQSHIRAAGRISPRPDLPPLYAQLNPANLKLHPVQPETSENYEQLLKEWQEIFQ